MIIEGFLAKNLYDKLNDNKQKESFSDGGNGFSFFGFLAAIMSAVLLVAYFIVVIRAVSVAYKCQGLGQALLALFLYPVYLVWNFTTMIQKTCKLGTIKQI
jgi:hypothetical protein